MIVAEQPNECHCCGFETEALRDYTWRSDDPTWYCDLCASTLTSRAHQHPEQFRGQAETMKAICYVGNAILKAIAESRVPTAAEPR